jgi:hypothetical protein
MPGIRLVLIGIGVSAGALSLKAAPHKIDRFGRPLLLILGPVVLFGLLLKPPGLVACLFMLPSPATRAMTFRGKPCSATRRR